MLGHPDAGTDLSQGLEQLEFPCCVLTEAEIEYPDVDRKAQHVRAPEACFIRQMELRT